MYLVYVIQSSKDGRLYVGFTQNMEQRLKYHNDGKVFSTKAYCPWKIVYMENAATRVQARMREKYLKSGIGKELLKKMIRE